MRSAQIGLLVVLLAGCTDDPPPPPVELNDLSGELIASLCEWSVSCRHVPSYAECERLVDPTDYDTRRAEDAIAAGRLAYDPAAAGACVAAQRTDACQANTFSTPACRGMFQGLRAIGETCTSTFECVDGAECTVTECDAQCCLGTCTAAVDPIDTSRGTAKPGDACESHPDCVPTAYCDFDRRCKTLPDEAGEPCVFGCKWGDLYCDIDSLSCKAFGALGEACDPAGIDAPKCDPAWSYCDGTCKRRPGEGDDCTHPDAACVASTYCDGTVCQPRGVAGDACTDSSECDVACDGQQCVEYSTCEG